MDVGWGCSGLIYLGRRWRVVVGVCDDGRLVVESGLRFDLCVGCLW